MYVLLPCEPGMTCTVVHHTVWSINSCHSLDGWDAMDITAITFLRQWIGAITRNGRFLLRTVCLDYAVAMVTAYFFRGQHSILDESFIDSLIRWHYDLKANTSARVFFY